MFSKDDNPIGDESIHRNSEKTPYLHTSITSEAIDSLPPEKVKAMLKDILKHQAELEKKKQNCTGLSHTDANCFSALFHSTPMAITIYELKEDSSLVLAHYNPASEQLVGIDLALLVGLTIEEVLPGLVDTNIPDMYRAIARGELEPQLYEQHYGDERFTGWFEITAFRVRENAVGVEVVDISERKL
ncbi:MAG: PAS domain-containing protein, partial [Colwellia sp.]|nr:PAS domain-containing protein [Colwellia sp.]